MSKPEQIGKPEVMYEGRIIEVVETPMKVGDKTIRFELARRSPGVRIIAVKDGKMLLIHEYRTEQDGYDYRLPGGKVFDALKDYRAHRDSPEAMMEHAKIAVIRETKEEMGLRVDDAEHIHTTSPGATVSWDLYYFVVEQFEELESQSLEDGEDITVKWKTLEEVEALCLNGSIKEERSVAVLLRYLAAQT